MPTEARETLGSPPRMRGKRCHFAISPFPSRITPADAGKTDYAQPAFAAEEDHPRGCGENPRSNIRAGF